jgi:hypothetical protein
MKKLEISKKRGKKEGDDSREKQSLDISSGLITGSCTGWGTVITLAT